jgi:hypothetical protein
MEELARVILECVFVRCQSLGYAGMGAYEQKRNEILQLWRKRPGRPPHDEISIAMKLESEGIPRKNIYQHLNKTTREQQRVLSEAMRQRRLRQRRADAAGRESGDVPNLV